MPAPRPTEADRLRRCRVIFERAHADNVAMAEAAKRVALDEIRLKQAAIDAMRSEHARPFRAVPAPVERPRFYWEEQD